LDELPQDNQSPLRIEKNIYAYYHIIIILLRAQ